MDIMSQKPLVKVVFSEDSLKESNYFFERLLEKVILDQLDLHLQVKGDILRSRNELKEDIE